MGKTLKIHVASLIAALPISMPLPGLAEIKRTLSTRYGDVAES